MVGGVIGTAAGVANMPGVLETAKDVLGMYFDNKVLTFGHRLKIE